MEKLVFGIKPTEGQPPYCQIAVKVEDVFIDASNTEYTIVCFADSDAAHSFLFSKFMEARACGFINMCFDRFCVRFLLNDSDVILDKDFNPFTPDKRHRDVFD